MRERRQRRAHCELSGGVRKKGGETGQGTRISGRNFARLSQEGADLPRGLSAHRGHGLRAAGPAAVQLAARLGVLYRGHQEGLSPHAACASNDSGAWVIAVQRSNPRSSSAKGGKAQRSNHTQ